MARTLRIVIYSVLAVICLASATILLMSEKYGALAAGMQLVLALFWIGLAVWTWRST